MTCIADSHFAVHPAPLEPPIRGGDPLDSTVLRAVESSVVKRGGRPVTFDWNNCSVVVDGRTDPDLIVEEIMLPWQRDTIGPRSSISDIDRERRDLYTRLSQRRLTDLRNLKTLIDQIRDMSPENGPIADALGLLGGAVHDYSFLEADVLRSEINAGRDHQ